MLKKVCANTEFKLYEDSPNGSFSGYGSVYGNYDRVNEAVAPGAFKNIDEFVTNGFIAVGHDWAALPIATITEAKSDDFGLWIKAEFHSTEAAQEARQVLKERIERGKFAGLSIGYEVLDSEPSDNGRVLKALNVFEISLVTVPANKLAGVTGAKDSPHAGESLDDQTERVLATAKEYVTRLKGLHDLRAKDNRTISASRRADLAELKTLIDDLVSLTAPKAKPDEAKAAYERFLALSFPNS